MTVSDAFTLLGFLLIVVGTLATATILLAPEWLAQPENQAGHRDVLATEHLARKNGYVSPPYPQATVDQAIADADAWYDEASTRLEQKILAARRTHEGRQQQFALIGVLLIGLGSGIQTLVSVLS